MEATKRKEEGHEVYWNEPWGEIDKTIVEPEGIPFLSLPSPDRVLTRARDYTSGNYKYLPGTHIQVANGCWHGKCTFCVEKGKPYEIRPLEEVIEEIKECQRLGFREVFDDSGTFPDEDWLTRFCIKKITTKEIHKLPFGCNMRIGANADFRLMKRAGFRMVLFGIESANQETLDRIQKGTKADEIISTIQSAAEAGLEPHIAVMFGYPSEKDSDSERTLRLVHFLLKKGYAKTAQASFYDCKGEQSNEKAKKYVRRIYDIAYSPQFWFNKFRDVKSIEDFKYLWRQIKTGLKEK